MRQSQLDPPKAAMSTEYRRRAAPPRTRKCQTVDRTRPASVSRIKLKVRDWCIGKVLLIHLDLDNYHMPPEIIKPGPPPTYVMTAYARNAKAVGVLWAIFTVCYAIVAVLVFFQPYWLGSTDRSEQAGVFGLYQYCTYSRTADVSVENCRGEVADYHRILSPYFKASTVLVGISAVIILLCIAVMILFLCIQPKFVFTVCACLQFLSCK